MKAEPTPIRVSTSVDSKVDQSDIGVYVNPSMAYGEEARYYYKTFAETTFGTEFQKKKND